MDIRSVVLPAAARENRFILTVFKVDALDVNTAGVLIRIVGIALVNIQITAAAFGDDGIIRTVVVYPAEISVRCVINVFVIECDSGAKRLPKVIRVVADILEFEGFRPRIGRVFGCFGNVFCRVLGIGKGRFTLAVFAVAGCKQGGAEYQKRQIREFFHKYLPFCEYKIQ